MFSCCLLKNHAGILRFNGGVKTGHGAEQK